MGGHADHAHVRARGHRRRRDHGRLPARRDRRAGSSTCGPATPRSAAAGVEQQGADRRRARSSWRALARSRAATRSCARSSRASSSTRGPGSGPRSARWRRPRVVGRSGLANIGKLAQTRIAKRSAEIALDMLGARRPALGPRRPPRGPLRRGAGVLGRVVDLRRHRPDPAQRHRRAGARTAA